MKNIITLSIALMAITLTGCEKEEGIGGRATIEGKVYIQLREKITNTLIAQYPATDERIYIIYGDTSQTIIDGDTRTSHDGSYRFKNLFPGTYQIFGYAECISCAEEQYAKIQIIEIGKKQEEVEANDIYLVRY